MDTLFVSFLLSFLSLLLYFFLFYFNALMCAIFAHTYACYYTLLLLWSKMQESKNLILIFILVNPLKKYIYHLNP